MNQLNKKAKIHFLAGEREGRCEISSIAETWLERFGRTEDVAAILDMQKLKANILAMSTSRIGMDCPNMPSRCCIARRPWSSCEDVVDLLRIRSAALVAQNPGPG